MVLYRILKIRKIENVLVEPGAIYDSLNQNQILNTFTKGKSLNLYPVNPKAVTAIYLRAGRNPLEIKAPAEDFIKMVERFKFIWEHQRCIQLRSAVDMSKILTFNGQTVAVENLAHAISHLLLPYAIDCRDPWVSRELLESKYNFQARERVFRNKNNPREAIIVFNFPTDGLDGFARIFLQFFTRWARGQFDDRLLEFLKKQAGLNFNLRFSKQPR